MLKRLIKKNWNLGYGGIDDEIDRFVRVMNKRLIFLLGNSFLKSTRAYISYCCYFEKSKLTIK